MFISRISKINKLRVVILAFFLVGLSLPFNIDYVHASGEGGTPIKIGVVMPLSGSCALEGNYVLDAIKLAVEETNKKGGINGRKIEIIAEDDKSVPVESTNAILKLTARDNVLAIIGAYNSSCTLADKEIIGKEKVVLITPVSMAAAITEEPNPYMFRNCATMSIKIGNLAKYMVEENNVKSIAMLLENTDYGRGAGEVISEIFKKYDRKVVTIEYFSIGDTDFYSQLTKIKSFGVKNVFFIGEIKEGALIVKQANELDFHPQFYSENNCGYPNFLELTGENAEGLRYVDTFNIKSKNPYFVKFVESYNSKYGRKPEEMSSCGYDAAHLIIEAIKGVGTEFTDLRTFRDAIRGALEKINYKEGVFGQIKFNEKGQNEVIKTYIVEIKNGKTEIIYP